jgi:hypothetical protein
MKETSYGGQLKNKLEKELGGKVLKISDRATLGLPDYSHVKDGIVTYIETKITVSKENGFIIPWNVIKKGTDGIRQYETCKSLASNALVLYAIYCSDSKMTAVLLLNYVSSVFAHTEKRLYHEENYYFTKGHGIDLIKTKILNYRRTIYERLKSELEV